MGAIPITAAAFITSLNVAYSNLPTTAYSYDGVERDVSQFYKQELPNITVGYAYVLDDDTYLSGWVDSGLKTDKLTVLPTVDININKDYTITDALTLSVSAGATVALATKHTPCTDSYDRKYYCANLTAWSDFEGSSYEEITDYQIDLQLSYKF